MVREKGFALIFIVQRLTFFFYYFCLLFSLVTRHSSLIIRSKYEKKLKEKKSSMWENSIQRNARKILNQKLLLRDQRNHKRKQMKRYCICTMSCCSNCPKTIPRCLRGPCVCLNSFIYHIIAFICLVVLPLSILLPIWIVSALNDSDLSIEITDAEGKLIWIIVLSIIPLIYLVCILSLCCKNSKKKKLRMLEVERMSRIERQKRRELEMSGSKSSKEKKIGNKKSANEQKEEGKNSSKQEDEEEEAINPDPLQRRILRRDHKWCTWWRVSHFFLFAIFFLTPALLGSIGYVTGPSGFFSSSLSSDQSRTMLLFFAIGPPYLYFLYMGLNWTLVLRSPTVSQLSSKGRTLYQSGAPSRQHSTIRNAPFFKKLRQKFSRIFGKPMYVQYPRYGTINSLRKGIREQMKLDEEFSLRLKWPTWLLYHYPKWSIGHGLMTTGERRLLINFYKYQVDYERCAIIGFFFVVFPICVLLPLAYQGNLTDIDPTKNVVLNILFAFAGGYPLTFVAFYLIRAVYSIIPKVVRSCMPIFFLHFFIFVIVPLVVVLPVYNSRSFYLHDDVAFYCQIIIYVLPISFSSLWGSVLISQFHNVFRW